MTPTETRLGALLLAAGGSRRLGRSKQLIEINGQPLVRRAAGLLLGLEPRIALVITGADAAAVVAALQGLPLNIMENADWRTGMGGSIAVGIDALPDDLDGVLIMLCDQWRIDGADLDRLRTAWAADPSRIAVADWGDSFGAPAIFPARLLGRLGALRGEAGAKTIIDSHPQAARFVPMENAGYDLDSADDLEALRQSEA